MKKFYENFKAKLKKDERGMTLVELLAVVVILAIIGLIAFVAIGKVIENSKQDAHIANAQQIISAAELYEASGGTIPEGQFAIDTIDTINPVDIINPWDKNQYDTKFKLTSAKTNGEAYVFTISATGTECDFGATSKADLAKEGRGICK